MPLLDDLKVFYEFEGDGTDAHTVGPYDLTAVNSPTFAAGKVNDAVEFDGANFPNVQSLRVNSNSDLQNGSIDFSYGLWVYLDSDPGEDRYVFSRWGSTGSTHRSCYLQWADAFNLLRFVVGYDSGGGSYTTNDVYSTQNVNVGSWYYVQCGHRNGSNIWIAINDNDQNTTNHTQGTLAGSARLNIGGFDSDDGSLTDKGWPGLVDQFGYWKRTIYGDQDALYNSGAGLSYAAMGGGGGGGGGAQNVYYRRRR
jgi:hypothetical protein